MYKCVKLSPGDLNPDPSPPHPTSTYICGVTIAPRMCGGIDIYLVWAHMFYFS